MRVLYLSYDGALDPLGKSQVVPYIEGLSRLGHEFDLVTFEKPARWRRSGERADMVERLRSSGVRWHPRRYHKSPALVSTASDLAVGFATSLALSKRHRHHLVHARSYPAALIALLLQRTLRIPYLFDMRGLYPEERVDGGLWAAEGRPFRVAKRLERAFLGGASGVVTLTHASLPAVQGLMADAASAARLEVIPTSVDLARFTPRPREVDGFTLAYFGSVGTWYLLDEMMAFGAALLRVESSARLAFVVNDSHEVVRAAASRAGIPSDKLTVTTVAYESVPATIGGASATFAFIKPAPSKIASAATKFSESLALGLPAIANHGVGDAAELIRQKRVGVVVDPFDPASFVAKAAELTELCRQSDVRQRCRQVAERSFDLNSAVTAYDNLYRRIGETSSAGLPAT